MILLDILKVFKNHSSNQNVAEKRDNILAQYLGLEMLLQFLFWVVIEAAELCTRTVKIDFLGSLRWSEDQAEYIHKHF